MIETNKREGIYSFIHTPLLTVAIHVFSSQHHNRTADPFSAHMVFLSFSTPPSSLLAADSDHKKDFYAHPLASEPQHRLVVPRGSRRSRLHLRQPAVRL